MVESVLLRKAGLAPLTSMTHLKVQEIIILWFYSYVAWWQLNTSYTSCFFSDCCGGEKSRFFVNVVPLISLNVRILLQPTFGLMLTTVSPTLQKKWFSLFQSKCPASRHQLHAKMWVTNLCYLPNSNSPVLTNIYQTYYRLMKFHRASKMYSNLYSQNLLIRMYVQVVV